MEKAESEMALKPVFGIDEIILEIPADLILSEVISYPRPLANAAVSYPGSMTAATSWCTRDRQDRRPSPVDSLHAFGSTGLLACHE